MSIVPTKKMRPCDLGQTCVCFINNGTVGGCPHAKEYIDPVFDLGDEFEKQSVEACSENETWIPDESLASIPMENWKIALYDIQKNGKKIDVSLKLINTDKDVITLGFYQRENSFSNSWVGTIEVSDRKENVIIEANCMLRRLRDVAFDHHPDKVRMVMKKEEMQGTGLFFIREIERYLTPIDESTMEDWKKEIQQIVNRHYRTARRNPVNDSYQWDLAIIEGERAKKMIALLQHEMGLLMKDKHDRYSFNHKLSKELASSKGLKIAITDFLKRSGIVIL